MSTVNSTIYAKQISPTMGNRVPVTDLQLKPKVATVLYTMLGTEAANDLINLCVLPEGAIVDPTHSSLTTDGVATTCTLSVGDTDDTTAAVADRYAVALNPAAAGHALFSSTAGAARLTPYALQKDTVIQAKFLTLVTPVAGKKLLFRIGYLGAQ
jgi:hypothetical protein